jgi:hypothetical protein
MGAQNCTIWGVPVLFNRLLMLAIGESFIYFEFENT